MKLSTAALDALVALQDDQRCIISTLRTDDGDDWRAEIGYREFVHPRRWTVPIAVFRKLRRMGYVAKETEHQVSGTLMRSVYVLTDTGTAAIALERSRP